jgi:hypothetical protein
MTVAVHISHHDRPVDRWQSYRGRGKPNDPLLGQITRPELETPIRSTTPRPVSSATIKEVGSVLAANGNESLPPFRNTVPKMLFDPVLV